MKENLLLKAFDFASDTTKQLISLSTAIIALTVTFSKDVIGEIDNFSKIFLYVTWGVLIFSVLAGIATMMAMTGTLDSKPKDPSSKSPEQSQNTEQTQNVTPPNQSYPSTFESNITTWAITQILSFLVGLIMTAVYGGLLLSSNQQKPNHKDEYAIIRKSLLNRDTVTVYIDTLYLPKYEKPK